MVNAELFAVNTHYIKSVKIALEEEIISVLFAVCIVAHKILLSQHVLLELDALLKRAVRLEWCSLLIRRMSSITAVQRVAPKFLGNIGDQHIDLLRLFQLVDFPPYSNYLFFDDYTDRGRSSLEFS
ncbi:unnamed protein product [Dracunculus medinensis]|uniref:NR LBD domain-containing protein n=1 Tax=Dracunculus medinensis TaxID=318479 RepID=A0A0N4UMV1_DRAME|nr:unnamed protein product [Dracunculus medinensis]